MGNVWNKLNPLRSGDYICRMDNGYIKMCHWDGDKWFDIWKPTLVGIVVEWMLIPYDGLPNNQVESEINPKKVSPIIEGRTKSNVKNNTQTKRLAPPPPPMKRGVIY